MRDLIGPAWKESGVGAIEGEQTTLADFVFQALYVKRKRQYPKASEENREKNLGVEVTCHEVLSGWIAEALNKKDVGFFARLTEAMAALKKVFPSGINGEMEPDDKWRWTAAWFIWKYWNKHGCAPRQQAVREHLESMEHYHGQPTPQTGPLPKKTWTKERRREGSFQHVDRKGGPPKKPVR